MGEFDAAVVHRTLAVALELREGWGEFIPEGVERAALVLDASAARTCTPAVAARAWRRRGRRRVDLVVLALAGTGTALATGLGAIPVSRLGARAGVLRPALWGMTVGLMSVASILGLLLPALDEGSTVSVLAGLGSGVLFLLASRRLLQGREVHVGALRGAGVRRSVLVFGVLLVHSYPIAVEQLSRSSWPACWHCWRSISSSCACLVAARQAHRGDELRRPR